MVHQMEQERRNEREILTVTMIIAKSCETDIECHTKSMPATYIFKNLLNLSKGTLQDLIAQIIQKNK